MFNLKHDILPVGDYETLPIAGDTNPNNFPEVVKLNIKTDVEKLRSEYNSFPKDTTKSYFKKQAKHFKVGFREVYRFFEDIGFNMKTYFAYPLREMGTNKLLAETGTYTKNLLENFGCDLFRQQYVLALGPWKSKFHQDLYDFSMHGYRVFIPIDDAHINFENGNYKLEAGDCYFVNIAKIHQGLTYEDRVIIMVQLSNDRLIKNGTTLKPL
jgi:hypothetical protein